MSNSAKRIYLPLLFSLALLVGKADLFSSSEATAAYPHYRVWRVPPTPFPPFYNPYYSYYPPAYPLYPMYYSPYSAGPYSIGDPYGGYLKGAADVINSQGQYLKATQEAYLLKEQVKAAQIQNRRRAYDEWLFEQANTPTLNEQRERIQREEVRRGMNNPPITEIWSAKTLNDILANLQDLQAKGIDGPAVLLDAATLKSINVTNGKGPANTGLLKDAGKLNWPNTLRTLPPEAETRALRAQIDALLVEGKKQALQRGRVNGGITAELERSIDALRKNLAGRVGEYSFNDYSEAKRFLNQLDDALTVLQQPDAGNYLNGKFAAQGANVKELVQNMTENGLRFAPATSGEEAAYTALYQSLLQYNREASKRLQTR
jgi:hypothetical protein